MTTSTTTRGSWYISDVEAPRTAWRTSGQLHSAVASLPLVQAHLVGLVCFPSLYVQGLLEYQLKYFVRSGAGLRELLYPRGEAVAVRHPLQANVSPVLTQGQPQDYGAHCQGCL